MTADTKGSSQRADETKDSRLTETNNSATGEDEGRPRSPSFEEAVENAIQRGLRDGAFDNLSGKGKPLRWESAQDDEWWLANHMLRNGGYTPEWIDRSKSLRAQIEQARGLLANFETWHQARKSTASPEDLRQALTVREKAFRDLVAQLNSAIDAYNITCPVVSARLRRINVDDEITEWKSRLTL